MKHTPGPWIAIHDHDKNYVEPVEETPRGDYLAYCSGQGDIDIETARANSDLMAAAPDLLAALEAVPEWAYFSAGTGGRFYRQCPVCKGHYPRHNADCLRSSIRKAVGEASNGAQP